FARVATGSAEIQNHIHMAISGIFFLRKILQDMALDLLDRAMRPHMREPVEVLSYEVVTYCSSIFKVVQQKRCKALYTGLTESLKSPEYAVGEGSERSNIDRSVAVPQ